MMVVLPTFDSQKVSTLILSENSVWSGSTGTWTQVSLPVFIVIGTAIKFDFDFSISNDSEQGLSLAPRIPFTAATLDPTGSGETADVWNLTISTTRTAWPTGLGSDAGPVVLSSVFIPNPEDLDNDNPPTTGFAYTIKSVAVTDTDNWVLNSNGSTFDLTFDLDFTTTYTNTTSGASIPAALLTTVNNSVWNGRLIFFLTPSTFWSATISSISFTGKVHDWHTGQMGAKMGQRGRAVHGYITGQPYHSNEAVADGFRDGIMVHPDNWDPADPLDTDPFTPPPGESVVDDEVTDIE